MTNSQDYRKRLYDVYASHIKGLDRDFNVSSAERWGRSYDYYFRGWLPKQKVAAIADVGCGCGNLLHYFKRQGYTNISGVDISPEQTCLAQQVTPNITQGSALEFLEAHTESFDLITGLDIIEHLRKDEALRLLDSSYAALKPGGRLILQTPNPDSPFASSIRYGDFTHELSFGPVLLTKLMALSGYEELVIRETCPPPWGYSFFASVRHLLWQCLRFGIAFYNTVETGGKGSGVYSRVFLASGIKAQGGETGVHAP